MISDDELKEIKILLDSAENKIRQAKTKLFSSEVSKKAVMLEDTDDENAVSGIFDGEGMITSDKKKYQVPANYASKSKLVPGDVLKLTITDDGKYIFKQIGPVERKNLIGVLEESGSDEFQVDVEGKKYRVLLASITYFKAKPSDKLSITIPAEGESEWAAVDNIL